MYITWLRGRSLEKTPSTVFTVVDETRAASTKPREVLERADRVELITKHGFSDFLQASCEFEMKKSPLETTALKMFNGASRATQLSYRDTSGMNISEKITTTISFVVTSAAKGAGGTLGKFLKNFYE